MLMSAMSFTITATRMPCQQQQQQQQPVLMSRRAKADGRCTKVVHQEVVLGGDNRQKETVAVGPNDLLPPGGNTLCLTEHR